MDQLFKRNPKCKTCMYKGKFTASTHCCNYYIIEKKRRTNPKIEDCVDYKKGKPIKLDNSGMPTNHDWIE